MGLAILLLLSISLHKPHSQVSNQSQQPSLPYQLYQPKPKPKFIPTIKEGGRNLENITRSQAINALRGQGPITEGTIIHEATHFLQSNNLSNPHKGSCSFYLWGKNQYLIMPTANFRKGLVLDLVPRDAVTAGNINVYFNSYDYASRDAIHIIEDFVAELNGFEADSPSLLRDMLVFSVALSLKMQQVNHEQLLQYQAGNKYLIEQSIKKSIDLTNFKSSTNQKSVILRNYLKKTYGEEWFSSQFKS